MTLNWLKKLKRTNSIFKTKYRNQLFAAFVMHIISFSHGLALGWSAPTLKNLTSEETPLNFKISINEASWIGSLIALGSLVGNILFGNCVDLIGRKPCLILNSLPHMLAWGLIFLANSVEYIYVGRFIAGITGGINITVGSLFLGEISDKDLRGTFTSLCIVALGLGYLFGYILCSMLSYFLIPCICVLLPIIYFLLVLQLPDTPQYLLKKEKHDIAFEAFKYYKNSTDVKKCQQEFTEFKATLEACNANTKIEFKDFVTKPALKAYLTSAVILLLSNSSGIYIFTIYMSDIFVISGTPTDPNTSTIIIGVAQLFGYISSSYFIDQCGRKKLMIISAIGVILGLSAFGSYTFLKDSLNLMKYSWIPLVLMIFIIFIGSVGVSSLYLVLLVEILPIKIRSYVLSACLIFFSFVLFISLKIFPNCMHSYGLSFSVWTLAGISAVLLLYLIIFLQETKGKSIDES